MKHQNFLMGEQVSHFTLKEICDLSECQAKGYVFVHDVTGMEVCFVENDDNEQFFSYIVRTIPTDDSGVPHILEHSTLSGSQLYPVHDPFMDLEKGSTNTYLNAMTYPDKTIYLAASTLDKDFSNLFSVYTDAVFHPLLRKEAFEQEGIRLADDGKGPHWEGVVFSEMLGVSGDHDALVARSVIKSLYPDDCYRFESGGEPGSIIHLGYDQYLEYYKQQYHPSNCRLLVYGNNDIPSILAYLEDGYLKDYTKGAMLPAVRLCPQWNGKSRIFPGPKEGEGKKNDASIMVAWRTTSYSDPLEATTLDVLTDLLLDDTTCPLYKAILDSGLGDDVSPESGMVSDFPEMPFLVGIKGIEPHKEQAVDDLITTTLARIIKDGIGTEAIEGRFKRSRFKQQEIPGSVPRGLRLMDRALHGWLDGKSPFATMQVGPSLDELEKKLKEDARYFEHWMQKNLLDNPKKVIVSVYPDDAYLKNQQEYLAAEAKKAVGHTVDFDEDTRRFLQYENTPDSPEAHQSVPRLSIKDLPADIKPNVYQTVQCLGRPVYLMSQFCNGIVYLSQSILVDDLTDEELKYLSLYTRLVLETGIGKMTEREASLKMKRLFGGVTIIVDCDTSLKDNLSHSTITLYMKMRKEDVPAALAFASDLWLHANVGDVRMIKVALTDLKGDYRDNVTDGASGFAMQLASAPFTQSAWECEQLGGISQWLFLCGLKRMEDVARMMVSLQKKLIVRNRMAFHLSSDEPLSQMETVEHYAGTFPQGEVSSVRRSYSLIRQGEEQCRAYSLPTNVSYCALVHRSDPVLSLSQVRQAVLAQIMTTNDLWSLVRMKGGAYGEEVRANPIDGLFQFSTYRDPRISGSFSDYLSVLEHYSKEAPSEEEIENAKISLIGLELKPQGPHQAAMLSFKRILLQYDDDIREKRRKQLLSVNGEDLRDATKHLLQYYAEGTSKVVLTSRKMLQKDGKLNVQLESLPL